MIDLHFHWPWATHIFLALLRTAASDGTFGEKGVIYIFTASGMQQATVKVSKLRLTHLDRSITLRYKKKIEIHK